MDENDWVKERLNVVF